MCITLFLLVSVSSNGQDPVFTNYGVDDGFPSSEVYHSIQDSKGFMWFTTDRGVVRYDGFEFEVFTTKDGLAENVNFKMFEDRLGRIWFVSMGAKFTYYENGRFVFWEHNDKLPEFKFNPLVKDFYIDSALTIYIRLKYMGIISISSTGKVDIIGLKTNHFDSDGLFRTELFKVRRIDNYQVMLYSYAVKDRNAHTNFNSEQAFFEWHVGLVDTTIVYPRPFGMPVNEEEYKISYSEFDQSYYANFFGSLYRIDTINKRVSKIFDFSQLSFDLEIFDNTICIGLSSHGLVTYSLETKKVCTYLNGNSVTSITKDNSGGYWFSTLENGVFYTPSFKLLTYNESNGLSDPYITAMNCTKNGLFVGTKSGAVFSQASDSSFSSVPIQSQNTHKIRVTNIESNDEDIIIFSDRIHSLNKNLKVTSYMESGSAPTYVEKLKSGQLVTCRTWVYKIELEKIHDGLFVTNSGMLIHKDGNCNCIAGNVIDSLYIGRPNGLYLLHNSSGTYEFSSMKHLNALLGSEIKELEMMSHGIVVGTSDKGVIVVNKDTILSFNTENGLVSDQISSLYVDATNNVWVSTNEGLNLITADYKVKTLLPEQGLPSKEVNCVIRDSNTVWIGTKQGLVKLNYSFFEEKISRDNVHIRAVSTPDGTVYNAEKPISLPYDKSTIQIQVTSLNFKNKGKVNFRYRIPELGDDWIQTSSNYIQLSYIPAGEYHVEIEAQNEVGMWSDKPTVISLQITPPFWKTTWFIVVVFTFLLLTGTIVFYARLRVRRRQDKLISEINEYQQQALASQMNPHFIFNSLNSIQSFIAQNDRKLSNHYLARFAKLMRITLDNSRRPEITLKEEIESLELYLELESVRYTNFNYNIDTDEMLDVNKVLIPPLLLQPLVENAIWHGLMHKNEKGNLTISFKIKENKIRCCVEDDGVGRAYSTTKISIKTHESLSTTITNKRLELLSAQISEKYKLDVTDLVNKNGEPSGTRVCFYIPLKQNAHEKNNYSDS